MPAIQEGDVDKPPSFTQTAIAEESEFKTYRCAGAMPFRTAVPGQLYQPGFLRLSADLTESPSPLKEAGMGTSMYWMR
jgi:hypothetical protein